MRSRVRSLLEFVGGGLVLVLAVIWLSGGFGERIPPGQVEAPGTRALPPDARLAPVEESVLPVMERFSGTLASARHTTVSSKILARIEDVRVRAGDDVKAGDVLVVLDSRDLAARASEAEQALTAAQSELALAGKERGRIENLFAQGVATRRDVDRALSADQVASAEVQRAQQRLRDARVGLSNAELLAPGSGRVVDRLAEPGDTAAPGTPLLRIYDPGVLRLESPVRESLARFLSVGQSLPVYVEAIQETLAGVVEEIVPYAEPGARSFLVKVRLPPQPMLFAGMFGRMEIPAGEARRTLVPAAAVQRIGQLELVDVATTDGRLERRLVTTTESDAEGRLEVLSGLAAGERVLLPEAPQPG